MSNPSPQSAFLNKKIQADCGRRAKRRGEASLNPKGEGFYPPRGG